MIRVQSETFDAGAELNAFTTRSVGVGAITSFTGVVRDDTGELFAMEIEHYDGMTQNALAAIRADAMARWNLSDALIIHRFGRLKAGDVIMMVATASRHRKDAFEAAEFLMDFLKSRAPFWKKEINDDGTSWVAAKETDEDALDRW